MVSNSGRKKRLIVMFTLTFVYMIAELIVGYWGHATTLLTDAFHMLSDVIALLIGFTAIHLSPKKWDKNTFGWARTEVLGALVNAVFLLALCFTIIMESIQKFISPLPLERVELILIIGGGGLILNVIGLCIFREAAGDGKQSLGSEETGSVDERKSSLIQNQNRLTRIIVPSITVSSVPILPPDSIQSLLSNENEPLTITTGLSEKLLPQLQENQEVTTSGDPAKSNSNKNQVYMVRQKKSVNMRSVFLHLMADTLNSVVVMITAGTTYIVSKYIGPDYDDQPEWKWVNYLDPTLSVLIVSLICLSTWPLLQETSMILLQNVPPHMSVNQLKKQLLAEVDGISGIHEFHLWQLAGDKFYATIHVKCPNVNEYERICKEIKNYFHKQGIHETTVQAEIMPLVETKRSESCLLVAEEIQEEPTTSQQP